MTHEQITEKIRELCATQLDAMSQMPLLSSDLLSDLAKIALILQRTKTAAVDPEIASTQVPPYSVEKMMKAAGGSINE